MNQQQIKELLENEEMEVNESLYLKQLIEMEENKKQQELSFDELIKDSLDKHIKLEEISIIDYTKYRSSLINISTEVQTKIVKELSDYSFTLTKEFYTNDFTVATCKLEINNIDEENWHYINLIIKNILTEYRESIKINK